VVFITSSYGLGETVVQGAVNPDEFYVHKPMLQAGKQAVIRRNLGSKLIQMVFATDARRPRAAAWSDDRRAAGAAQPLFAERRRRRGAGAATP
jgi:phosphoenolpyruvate synthase/pyruvate phosphate dikinase